MGKYEAKKTKKRKRRRARKSGVKTLVLILAILLLTAALVLFVVPQVLYRLSGDAQIQTTEQTELTGAPVEEIPAETTEAPVLEMAFPVMLENGNIEVESLFSFSGVNPDAGNQEATDVASIVLKNTSGKYLAEATVTAILADGSERRFALENIPAGASAMAFSVENDKLLATDLCVDMSAEAVFEEAPGNAGAEIIVEGMTVTVTNTSAAELNGIDVYYRDVFDGKYFGGTTYCCNIEKLSVGESMTFTAEESLLGVIEVVRVAVND